MRKQDSFFNEVATFINSIPVGETFTSAQYINAVGGGENVTRWKILSRNTNYRAHQYKGMLKRYFVQHVKRGTWKVTHHIPEWFTTAHLWTLNFYTNTYRQRYDENGKYHYDPTPRTSMSRDEILAKLEVEKNPDEIFNQMAISMADESVLKERMISELNAKKEEAQKTLQILISEPVLKSKEQPMEINPAPISREESVFFKGETRNPAEAKDQLIQNLQMNVGLINAAVIVVDQINIIDPLIQGRVVNIFEQLQSLLNTVNNRIHNSSL